MNGRAVQAHPAERHLGTPGPMLTAAPVGQRKAAFLDKDGTLIRDVPFNVDPTRIELLPGVLEGLQQLHQRGFLLFVVSNQPGLARGLFDEEQLDAVWLRLNALVAPAGLQFEGFYYCPHEAGQPGLPLCSCHKPSPGLLWRAAVEHNLDLHHSWMIGDILHDVEAGHGAGCRSALIDNGGETEWRYGPTRVPDVIAHDFLGAIQLMEDRRHQSKVRRSRYGVLL